MDTRSATARHFEKLNFLSSNYFLVSWFSKAVNNDPRSLFENPSSLIARLKLDLLIHDQCSESAIMAMANEKQPVHFEAGFIRHLLEAFP